MARIARRTLLPMLALPALAACGFRPVYGPAVGGKGGAAAAELAAISVAPIPDRSGQLLRLALQERFERAGVAAARKYDLGVTFIIGGDAIGVRQDSTSTYVRVTGTAAYTLVAQDPSRTTVTSGSARSLDGFNLYDNAFFDLDLENDAVQRRLAQTLADQIALQLASFFARQAAKTAG